MLVGAPRDLRGRPPFADDVDALIEPADPAPVAGWSRLAGHVALSLGQGGVISTDIGGAGTVSQVPLAEITPDGAIPT